MPQGLFAGHYRILARLGEGGMGAVFRARHESTGREVAIKLLNASNEAARARFQREAQLTARLRHPNVVAIHEAGVCEGREFLVYELVEGARPLDEAWRELPLEARLELLDQVAAGVQAAHGAGIVHRDLKPENVLVRPNGSPVVLDFGLARAEEGSDLTKTGQLIGTPSHMAPEQLRGKATTPATDAWALGVLLYEAVYERNPFVEAAPTLMHALAKISACEPDYPAGPDPSLLKVIRRTLVLEPGERLSDAAEFRRALAEAREAAGKGSGERTLVAALAALALVAIALGAAWTARGGGLAKPSATQAAPSPSPGATDAPPGTTKPLPQAFEHGAPSAAYMVTFLSSSKLVVGGPGFLRCFDLSTSPATLLAVRAPGALRAIPAPGGVLLPRLDGTRLLGEDLVLSESSKEAAALDFDPLEGETLLTGRGGLEIRDAGGELVRRYEVPSANRIEAGVLLPGRVLVNPTSARGDMQRPGVWPRQLHVLPREGPGEAETVPGLSMPGRHFVRVPGGLVFATETALIEVSEELGDPQPYARRRAESESPELALGEGAHHGAVRGICAYRGKLLTWALGRRDGQGGRLLGELKVWKRSTRKEVDVFRGLPISAIAVHPEVSMALEKRGIPVLSLVPNPAQQGGSDSRGLRE